MTTEGTRGSVRLFSIIMPRSPFATLVFRGKRFDEAAMPLEALPELAAYRDLLAAVARELFLAENPGRVRLPKGFSSSFRLSLARVEQGSAVPIVERELPEPQLVAGFDFFDRARDEVASAIQAAASNAAMPSWLTPSVTAKFTSFGRTLKDDEVVVLAPAGKRDGAEYSRHVRRRILLAGQGTYEEDVDLVGLVRAADADQDSFQIRLGDDRRIPARVSSGFLTQVLQAFERDTPIRVTGTGVYDAEDRLLRIAQATDIAIAEEGDIPSSRPGCRISVPEQVQSLGALQDGWLDGEGRAFSEEQLAWSANLLEGIVNGFELATPYIYPTPDGSVRAEWSRPLWEISAELDWARRHSEVRAVRIDSDEMREGSFPLVEAGQEIRLGSFLANQMRAEA